MKVTKDFKKFMVAARKITGTNTLSVLDNGRRIKNEKIKKDY